MKQYNVKITDKALADMEAIYNYISEELLNPDAAMRQYNRIADAVASLNVFPERCRLFDSLPEHDLGMRQILVDNYSVVYVIERADVVVLRVLYSASDVNARLRDDI